MSRRKRLRVIHLGKYYPPATGGIETHTRTLCQSLAAEEVDVEVVVVNHRNAAGEDVTFSLTGRTPTVDERDGPVRVHRVGRLANVAKLDVTPGLPRLLRRLRKDPPDLWHLHAPNVTMMAALAPLTGVRPLVITHHSDIVRQRVLKHAVRPLENLIYGRAVRILPTSAEYAAGSSLLQRHAARVTPLPLGIDLVPFQSPTLAAQAYADKLKAEHGGPLWLSVGRLIYYKALNVALAALREVPGKFLIVGGGPMEAAWRAEAQALGVADRVVWLGRTTDDELVGAYLAATAYWFPSNARGEAFGLVQVEAMAAGCPVINAAIPGSGVPGVSPHEVSGLTVPINDAQAWAGAARRLLNDPGLRERLAQGGRERAAAEYDHRVMAARARAIYDGCLTSNHV